MATQTIRAEAFAALHRRPSIFAIPNPWDAGSAKMLAALGFEALATTSAGLENGFADDPQACAETIRLAAGVGVVGGSIEDATGSAAAPIYPFDHAVERVKAAAAAARGLPFPFMLTARCENF